MAEQGSHDVITVVLTADNHLGYFAQHASRGHMYGAPRPIDGGPRFTRVQEGLRRLRRAFQQATDFAVGQGVDLFIQAGDLFDTPSPSEEDRSFVAARLAEMRQAGIRVFAVSGIHDTLVERGFSAGDEGSVAGMIERGGALSAGLAPQVSYGRLGALHYFPPVSMYRQSNAVGSRFIELQPVMVDVRGVLVAVCGLSVCAGQEGDPLAAVQVPSDSERAAFSLLILHAPIEGLLSQEGGMQEGEIPEVARSTIVWQSSFGAILAGYHHGYRRMRFGQTDVVVAGATQHVDFKDADEEPGFVFMGLAADGIRWCHHVPGEALHVRRLVIDAAELFASETSDAGIIGHRTTDGILERLGPLCTADSMVQLRLVGELSRDQYHQLDLGRIRNYGEEHCFDLAIDESGLSLVPVGAALETIALSSNGLPASGPDRHKALSLQPAALEERGGKLAEALPFRRPPGEVLKREKEMEERLSPRKELVNLADEWIEASDDEQEKKARIATKEELLAALEGQAQGTVPTALREAKG